MSELYIRISERKIPVDANGGVLLDLYILMPASRRYIAFVKKGDKFNDDKKDKLKKHVLPDLFVLPSELDAANKQAHNRADLEYDDSEETKLEVLGVKAEKDLKKICFDLLTDEAKDPQMLVSSLQMSSDKILSIVAPDSKELTKIFFSNAKYVNLMNDASAIVSLAVMFAFANGFDSKKSYLELTQAALVMDVSLSHLSDEHRKQMYLDPENLPEDIKKLIIEHPKRSFELVQKKIPGLSEITMQLILNHHELFNGRGYPRKVRSESLFPLIKILALAVDAYDNLKKAQYLGSTTDLETIVFDMHNSDTEAHLRRHNRTVTQKVLEFFDKNQANAA